MTDLKSSLKISADASGVEAGVATAKRSLKTLGETAVRASQDAAKGMEGMGDGSDKAGKKIERDARRIVASLQSEIVALEAGGRATVAYQVGMANLKGIDGSALKPLLDRLEEVRAAQAKASISLAGGAASLDIVGISAKQTAAALRGVPAQFTDIITSIQGGQAPLTVLLQQGGQLKDMFGGAGNAAKALGGYVVGLINPYTTAAVAAAALGFAYYKGAQEVKAFETSLALSGNASGVTVDQMRQLATTTVSSADALTQFARAGVVGTEGLQKFSEAAERFEKYTGFAVKESVAAWKTLGDEPVKSALKLNETISFLTPTIYRQIKALDEQGKAFEASVLAQDAFAKAQQRISDGAESKLNAVSYGWDQIAKSIGGAFKALKNYTNGDDVDKRIGASQATIASATKGLELARSRGEDGRVAQYQKIIDLETKHLFMLQSGLSLEKGASTEKSEQAKRLDAQSAFDKEHDKYLAKSVQQERELAKVRGDAARSNAGLQKIVDYGGAGADEARKTLLENKRKLAESEAGIRDKFKGAKAPAAAKPDAYMTDVARVYTKALEDLDKVQITASASADKLSKTQEILRGVQASPEWATFSRRKQEEVIMAASLSQAEEDRRAALDAAKKAQDAYNASARESANAISNKLEALGDETRAYAIATEKNISLAEAIDLVAIARLEDEVIRAKIADNYTGVKELEREIELRKELAKELRKKADNTAMVDAGKKAAAETTAEWKRGWEETDRIARDVFTSWATDGGNAAQKIGDTLKKALLSAIYEATLKPLVMQIYTSVAGGGVAGATGTLDLAKSAGSATSALSGFSTVTSKATSWFSSLFSSGAAGGSATKAALYSNAGYGATGAAATGSAGFAGIPVAGWIAMGMMASASAHDQGFRGDTGASSFSAGPNAPIDLTDRVLQAIGLDSRTAGIISGAPLQAAAMKFIFGGSSVSGAGGALVGTLSSTSANLQQRTDYTQDHRGVLGIGSYTTHNSEYAAASSGISDYVGLALTGITVSAKSFAASIGLDASAVDRFTKAIEVNTTGMDDAAAKVAIDAELVKFSNEQISAAYGDAVNDYAKIGESVGDTITRLSGDMAGVNSVFGALGYTLYDVSVAGAAAASGLASAFGNLAAMQSQTASLYNNYYTQAEQKAYTVTSAANSLNAAGITEFTAADISGATREQVRAVVDQYSAKIGTTEGDKQYAAVVAAANTITSYVPAFETAAKEPAPVVSAGGGSGGGGGDSAIASAASSVVSAWQTAADTIIGTMTDIRSSALESGPDSFAKLKAQFAIEIAQAGAGDLSAMQDLPALAKSLDAANKTNSKTAVDQAIFTAYILESLGKVSGAGNAGGALTAPNYTGFVIPAATAPQSFAPAYNPVVNIPATGGLTDAGLAVVFKKMDERLEKIEKSNENLRKMFFDVTEGGEHMNSKAV